MREYKATVWVAGLALLTGLFVYVAACWTAYYFAELDNVSLGDIFNGFLLLIALVAAVFAGWQLHDTAKTAKATFVKDLYSRMFEDSDIRDAFYLVEYGTFAWSRAQRGSAEERKMDHLLAFANLVCDLRERGTISSGDMGLFDYEFVRVYRDENVKDYMSALQAWYGQGAEPFASFNRYCRTRERDNRRPPVPAGEKWAHNSFGLNLARLKRMSAMVAGDAFAERGTQAVQHDLRLIARLATISTDVRRYPISTFLGELVGKLHWAHADLPAGGFIQSLLQFLRSGKTPIPAVTKIIKVAVPFAEWQYGTYALERGIDDTGWYRVGLLLEGAPEVATALVEALWSVGLLSVAGLDADAGHYSSTIRNATSDGERLTTLRGVTAGVRERLSMVVAGWGVPTPPPNWSAHKQRLWDNAVVMARARFELEGGNEAGFTVFKSLLAHAAAGRTWPLPHSANDTFESAADCVMLFRTEDPGRRPVHSQRAEPHVEFLSDPLEILNIGNAFGTCLRLAREGDEEETRSILGWATNVNIRVIAIVDANRALLARQTLGLCTRPPAGVLFGPIYPPDCSDELQEAIAGFRQSFLNQIGLAQVTANQHREVEMTCVKAYNGGWLATKVAPTP